MQAVYCLSKFYGQAKGLISSGQLNALLRLHIHPITSWSTRSLTGRSNLGSGFTLRCIQRLSMLHLATERYGWRHNSYTRGGSIPVLSYSGQTPSNVLRPPRIGTELCRDVLSPAHVPL